MSAPRVTSRDAYPLLWPIGWRRTQSREPARYDVPFSRARDQLLRSLRLLGATDVVISTNMPVRQDGGFYAKTREPADPGIAVYWMRKGDNQVMACDKWRTTRDNLRAIGLAIDAMRQLQRTGASDMLDRAFTGFAALPAQSATPEWQSVMFPEGLPYPYDVSTIERRYKELATKLHPDVETGSHEAFVALQVAYEAACKELTP